MKIKIGFFVPEIKNCGPINVVFNIIKNINFNKFEVMLIAVRKSSDNYVQKIQEKCSLGIYYLDDIKLYDICKDLDIIHSNGYYPDKLVATLKNKKIKKITTIHCQFFKDYTQEYGLIKGFLGALFHFYFLNIGNFYKIIGCSKSIQDYLLNYCYTNRKKITYISNGVDANIFSSLSTKEKVTKRQELGFQNENIFLFAGRLIRRKQVPELIKDFVKKDFPNSKLLILGEGEELSLCKEIANENVFFLGQVNTPQKYYQIADFVLSMSSAEGYPMSVLEAVSCGCYAFLSDIPSHREFIEQNRNCADFIDNLLRQNLNRKSIPNYNLSAQKMTDSYQNVYLNP